MFELFSHTADLGLRVRAPDFDGLLCDAARGLVAMIAENAPDSGSGRRIELRIPGSRPDYLLFDWLNEILFLFDTERLLPFDFRVVTGQDGIRASAAVTPFEPERHQLLHEVKAITYHALRVEREEDGWIAELIVDI